MSSFQFISGREWQTLSGVAQDAYVDEAFAFWRAHGFPYYKLDHDDMRRIWNQLALSPSDRIFLEDNGLHGSNVGLDLANHFHPQIWSVRFDRHRSPMECFNDDAILKECIRQALRLWPDRKGASPRGLRDILRTYRHTRRVSNFRPTIARGIYERYSMPGTRVLDFSAGYGGRLLGCLALDRTYIGYDPCEAQYVGSQELYGTLSGLGLTRASVKLDQICAEEAILGEDSGSFDLVFTSPPYFDKEKYSWEPTQSFVRYPTYGRWREGFLHVLLRESVRVLKQHGFLVLNVADVPGAPIATDMCRFTSELMPLRTVHQLRLSTLPYRRSTGLKRYHHEPIFVFQKL